VTFPQPVVRLRRVTESDANLILAWANDPETRAASFHPDLIDPVGHTRWMASRLASPTTGFWIGESDAGLAVGQVRVEGEELSISVAPDARGRGFGRALLAAAVEEAGRTLAVDRLVARVRLDNPASLALFTGGGFVEIGRGRCADVPCVELERRLR
jgi:UDP-2,4-diacetamido-2,4,6-trideoxy-beta-L-altropyranose hydrolase